MSLSSLIGGRSRLMDIPGHQTMNVMWAETTQGPKNAPSWKLPGPIVKPKAKTKKDSGVSKVLPKNSKAMALKKKKKTKTKERKKALADALASLGDEEEEDRPTPKMDNFAPVEGATKEGAPGSPVGGSGSGLVGNPKFAAYRSQIQRKITNNFVWLQQGSQLRAEISFRVSRSGEIMNPKITKSSGNTSFDQAGLRAIKKSSPLPTPPVELAKDVSREVFVIGFDPKSAQQ